MAAEEHSMPFIKKLASSDRKIRTTALSSLRTFLSARQTSASLTQLDILKLWKGLFYALWMADRAIPQQNLCDELADLITVLPHEGVVPWLRGFWATMSREWTGIDALRMEKFLLLTRRMLGASLAWMKVDGEWDRDRGEDVLGLLAEWPLSLEEQRETSDTLMPRSVPVGLRTHALDIWVDEAKKVGLLGEEDVEGQELLTRINGLVEALNKSTTATAVRIRSKEALADDRLPWNISEAAGIEGQAEDDDIADDGSWDGFND